MGDAGRTYRLTGAGQAAGEDLSVPADYRRMLGLIVTDTLGRIRAVK